MTSVLNHWNMNACMHFWIYNKLLIVPYCGKSKDCQLLLSYLRIYHQRWNRRWQLLATKLAIPIQLKVQYMEVSRRTSILLRYSCMMPKSILTGLCPLLLVTWGLHCNYMWKLNLCLNRPDLSSAIYVIISFYWKGEMWVWLQMTSSVASVWRDKKCQLDSVKWTY